MRTDQLSPKKAGEHGIFSLMAPALALPPPEYGALGRRDAPATQGPAEAPPRRRGLLETLHHWFWTWRQREVEAYLAKATDVYDLEARIRALERNVSHFGS